MVNAAATSNERLTFEIFIMKHSLIIVLFISSMLNFYTASSQSHMMKLDDSLQANSEFMEAKRKSISGAGKYEFGPYKIVSAKME